MVRSKFREPFLVPMLIWLSGLAFVLHLVHRQTGEHLLEYLAPARNLGFIVCTAWFLFKLIRELADNVIAKRLQNGAGADRTTVDGLSKISRIAVFVVSILMVMQTLGFSVSGVLAFGGVGGIAVGFAAKDLLANLFGGLMVHLDRPFNIGDKIRSPDKPVCAAQIWRCCMCPTRCLLPSLLRTSRACRISASKKPSRCAIKT